MIHIIWLEIKAWGVIINGLIHGKSLEAIAEEENAKAAQLRAARRSILSDMDFLELIILRVTVKPYRKTASIDSI